MHPNVLKRIKMIEKIIACADIHIPQYKGITELKVILKEFLGKCEKIVKNKPENVRIVVLGDIFHTKTSISNESIMCAHWFFSELDKFCKTYVIAGNHDFLMNNMDRLDSLTPLFEMGKYKQVIYLDKELGFKSGIYRDENVAFCLYSSFDGFKTPDISMYKTAHENEEVSYVGLIHGDINGAVSSTNYKTERGLEPTLFGDCDFVMAGHIHRFQEIVGNGTPIVYCSSMKQQNMGESVINHGFVVWDVSDYEYPEYKFHEIEDKDGGFYKFSLTKLEDLKEDKEEFINY